MFLAIVLYVPATTGQITTSPGLTSSDVVFLEHSMIANGTVIDGSVPFRSVDFPNYWFNENTRMLNGNIDFAVNDQLLLIYGDSLTLQGNFGAGTGNKLYGIFSLPARTDQAIIYYVDGSGNIGMYVDDRSVILRPGQEYSYNETETVKDGNGTVRIDYQHLFVNRGLIPKAGVQTGMVR